MWVSCLNPIPLEVSRPVEWGLGGDYFKPSLNLDNIVLFGLLNRAKILSTFAVDTAVIFVSSLTGIKVIVIDPQVIDFL